MIDYSELVNLLQKELGLRCSRSPGLLNVPGRSMACKLDPYYYLALHPGFVELLGKWAGRGSEVITEALVKTGVFATKPPERAPSIPLTLVWADGSVRRKLDVSFLDAAWVERGLAMYSGAQSPPISGLCIAKEERSAVDEFLENKTPVQGLGFA